MTQQDLLHTEFNEYYGRYIDKIPGETALLEGYEESKRTTSRFFASIPLAKQSYRYAEGKWTPKEVFQHLIDTERIFLYRCFRIARNDTTPLAGFDQDTYISPSLANEKSMEELLSEYTISRDHSLSILKSLQAEDLLKLGTASGFPISARAAAFIILGHEIWHQEIISERYL